MKPSILLVNNNAGENEIIQNCLSTIFGTHTLFNTEDRKSAFSILMGRLDERLAMILLNHDLLDMSSTDFLKLIQNYYTSNTNNIFLLTKLPLIARTRVF